MTELTHFNKSGEAHMVDVGKKDATHRIAVTEGRIRMLPETLDMIRAGGHKKGDVLGIARVAGIMAAKKTADLVPLCHPLALTHVTIELIPNSPGSTARPASRRAARQGWRWRLCALPRWLCSPSTTCARRWTGGW